MTLRTLNYGNYGIFLVMGNAGFCPSTVCLLRSGPIPEYIRVIVYDHIFLEHCSIVCIGIPILCSNTYESFRKLGVLYFGVLLIRILLFRVLC